METNVKAVELRELWRRYKEDGDERARERLVVAYSPLVKFIAGRMASGLPSHVEESDLISYGLLGLIGAIERFDLEREIKFETFAVARVKGAIIDELRSLDWVPRSVRARARDVEKANAELEAQLQRAPTDEEMAAKLDMARRRVPGLAPGDRQLLGAGPRRPVDVRRPGGQRRPDLGPRHDPRPERGRPGDRGAGVGAEGPPRRRDRVAAGARAPRGRPLLLREPDPARDRRGPRRHRVPRLPAPHQGGARRCARGSRLGRSCGSHAASAYIACRWRTRRPIGSATSR